MLKPEFLLVLLLSVIGATFYLTNNMNKSNFLEVENERLHYELEIERTKHGAYQNGVKDSN